MEGFKNPGWRRFGREGDSKGGESEGEEDMKINLAELPANLCNVDNSIYYLHLLLCVRGIPCNLSAHIYI